MADVEGSRDGEVMTKVFSVCNHCGFNDNIPDEDHINQISKGKLGSTRITAKYNYLQECEIASQAIKDKYNKEGKLKSDQHQHNIYICLNSNQQKEKKMIQFRYQLLVKQENSIICSEMKYIIDNALLVRQLYNNNNRNCENVDRLAVVLFCELTLDILSTVSNTIQLESLFSVVRVVHKK